MKISFFKSVTNTTPTETTTVVDFINAVKFGKWKEQVETIRTTKQDDKRKLLKRQLPAVTISGTFTEREQHKLIEHSGFICIDIDKYSDSSKLKNDPYSFAVFSSASGSGIAVIVRIKSDKHKESFAWLQNYYFTTYGIRIDAAPQNVASLRFASYDPETYINEKSKIALSTTKTKAVKSINIEVTKDKFEELVQQIVSGGIDIAPTYEDYLRLGFALSSEFGEAGREYFHALCCISSKYDSHHANKQYDYCLKSRGTGVGIGTFYHMAKQAGCQLPKQTKRFVDAGFDIEKAEQLAEFESEIEQVKSPQEVLTVIGKYIKINHKIRRNELTLKLEDDGKQLNERDINSMYLKCLFVYNSNKITDALFMKYLNSTNIPSFHPIKEWVNNNRYRNTTGNIDALIRSVNTDTPDAAIYIRKWLLQLPATLQGKQVRSVLTLVGRQNTGKTQFFRRLLPAELAHLYGESKLDRGKDDELLMCEKWILIDDEMGGKSRKDERAFKDLTSKSVFSLRAPYGKGNEDYYRLALLGGTSNDTQLINDPTGNTRILPVNVLSIDHELYNSIDKSELIMEIFRAYEAGERYELSREEMTRLEDLSDNFRPIPFERELILKYFTHGTEEMTPTEIKIYIENMSGQRILNMVRFGLECKIVFGECHVKKIDGKAYRIYKVSKNIDSQPQFDENQQVINDILF